MKKLDILSQEQILLQNRDAASIYGGRAERVCGCACYYRNVGGSSIADNSEANVAGGDHGLNSPQETVDKEITVVHEDGSRDVW